MKISILTVLSFLFLIVNINAQGPFCYSGGCTNLNKQYPPNTYTTTSSSWTSVNGNTINGGNYAYYNVTQGSTYEWTTCSDFYPASQGWDAQLTLMDASNNRLCYNDNSGRSNCPNAPYIGWTATYTGTVKVLVSVFSRISNI